MLPELYRDPQSHNALVGSIDIDGRKVALRVEPDDATVDQCLASASRAVSALGEIDRRAKETAARCLLANYNDNWRHYSMASAVGSLVEVHDPELTAHDFGARLTMTSLEALGADCYTVFYNDDRMFWGHSVVVTSFDGLLFADSSAELFG